ADGNETSKGKKPSSSSPSNTNTADADSSSSSTLPIILGVVAGVLAIALVAGFVYWRKNKPDATKTNNETNYTMVTGTMNGTNGTYTALWNDPDLLAMVSAGELRPAFTPSCPDKIMEMAQMCLSLRPLDRPTAAEVAYVLRSYMKSISS
ncbi:hypothetical protein PybrP1_012246, partial [[Pythium] brassicae (nom. inval.)]